MAFFLLRGVRADTMPAMRLFFVSLLVCAALALVLVRAPVQDTLRSMRAELAELQREVTALRERNRALARRAHFLRHDPIALERVARHRYGLVRADEWVLPAAPAHNAPPSVPASSAPPRGPALARSP